MTTEKGKGREAQALRLEAASKGPSGETVKEPPVEQLVALSYDSNPLVRLKACQALAKMDGPLVTLALVELGSDKDEEVKRVAREGLERLKDKQTYVSLEKLLRQGEAKEEEVVEARRTIEKKKVREQLMPSIEKLFAYIEDEERAERVKKMMLPSIMKLFSKKDIEPTERKIDQLIEEQKEKKVRQRRLFEEEQAAAQEKMELAKEAQMARPELWEARKAQEAKPEEKEEEMRRGKAAREGEEEPKVTYETPKVEKYVDALAGIERIKIDETLRQVAAGEEDEEEEEAEEGEITVEVEGPGYKKEIYRRAYNLVTAPGITKNMVKQEMKRLIREMTETVESAFKFALLRVERNEVETIAEMEQGMKDIITPVLEVAEAQEGEIRKQKRKVPGTRLVVRDASGQMVVYLWGERGKGIRVGDRVKFEKAFIDVYPGTGEVALSVKKLGKVYVIK